MPLTVALDMAKRLRQELSKYATPEQQRDFARLERLILESQQRHLQEISAARSAAAAAAATVVQEPPAPMRKSFWSRWGLGGSSS